MTAPIGQHMHQVCVWLADYPAHDAVREFLWENGIDSLTTCTRRPGLVLSKDDQ